MNSFDHKQNRLINLLSDGLCHSGNELAALLEMSRTAIWKRMKQLIDLKLPIRAIPQRGYQFQAPLTLLNEDSIRRELLLNHWREPIDIHITTTLDSTNRFLKESPRNQIISICSAEMQTKGRGRFNRSWYSPFGENIYASFRWPMDCCPSQLSGLSLVVSLAIVAMLNDLGVSEHLRVKWPNDVLWLDKKLSGSLIEVTGDAHGDAMVVIGIGLNVNSKTSEHLLQNTPWCSLYDITGQRFDRNTLLAHLIIHLNTVFNTFFKTGFSAFTKLWASSDYLQGLPITVSQRNVQLHGIAEGVNQSGQLLLKDNQGIIHVLSSGDASLSVV